METRDTNRIFKEVAQLAGDIVFCYDLITKKFMQYSDKAEISRYGAWMFDFANAMVVSNMIYEEDIERYKNLMSRIVRGDDGNLEGVFRMRLHASSDYRWQHIFARTKYDMGKPVEVIGRISDIHAYMTSLRGSMRVGDAGKDVETGIRDMDAFLDEIVRYGRIHRDHTMLACIIFNLPAYDAVIGQSTGEESEEFLVNITRRLERSFPCSAVIGRTGVHRFGVFTSGMNLAMELGPSIDSARRSLEELGKQYGVMLDVNVGACVEENESGAEAILYDRARAALAEANKKGLGNVIFYSEKPERLPETEQDAGAGDDLIVEYALRLFRDSVALSGEGWESREETNDRIRKGISALTAKVGERYGLDRIAISLCDDGKYCEYMQWRSENIKDIPEGGILHVVGPQESIEEKVGVDVPYIINNVAAYPDDSQYGQRIGMTQLKSVAQRAFWCSTGIKGIVSIERYRGLKPWTGQELEILDVTKYVAEFCAKYMG